MVYLIYAPDFYIFCVVVWLAEMGCYWFISFFGPELPARRDGGFSESLLGG